MMFPIGDSVPRSPKILATLVDWITAACSILFVAFFVLFVLQSVDGNGSPFCESHFVVTAKDADKDIQLVSQSGALCAMQIRDVSARSFGILQRPEAGMLLMNDRSSLIYRSNQNFHGNDSFAIRIEEPKEARTLRVAVRVR
jgi:hypothetical protein